MQETLLIDQYILYFVTYSFFGYVAEVIYCSIGQRKLVNRGFLHGPWLPIYGFGGLVIHMLTTDISLVPRNPVTVFLASMVFASVIEYLGSWMLEKGFGIKLWDYSSYPFNINARVCLKNSTLFGLGGLALTYGGHARFAGWIDKLPLAAMELSSKVLLVLMSVDFVLSVVRMRAFKAMLVDMQARVEESKRELDFLKSLGNDMARQVVRGKVIAELGSLRERSRKEGRRMLAKWPGMYSKLPDLQDMLARLRREDPLGDLKELLKNL